MSGVSKMLESLYPGISARRKRKTRAAAELESSVPAEKLKGATAKDPSIENNKIDEAKKTVQKRRRRKGTATVKTEEIAGPKALYSLTLVGTIALDTYPLLPGEKLIVAKLTPIAAGK